MRGTILISKKTLRYQALFFQRCAALGIHPNRYLKRVTGNGNPMKVPVKQWSGVLGRLGENTPGIIKLRYAIMEERELKKVVEDNIKSGIISSAVAKIKSMVTGEK